MFLSYAWSTSEHQDWVLALARRLMGDGVEVIIDKWGLGPGQDGNVFMERMVSDPEVTKVLMICDRLYVEKADGRRGGAGTEAQIISPQLYRNNSASQTKFAAAALAVDSSGDALVPVFYKGRIHFDFTRHAGFEAAYNEVLRWAHDLPLHVAPPLGARPEALATSAGRLVSIVPSRASSNQAIERVEVLRTERLDEISAARTPVPISKGAFAVLHMAPLPMFDTNETVDIVTMVQQGQEMPVPLAGQGGQVSVNLDGLCNTAGPGGYGQLARTGMYEGVHVFGIDNGASYIAGIAFANMVVGAVRRGLRLQAHYRLPHPIAILLSFGEASGLTMRLPTEFGAGYYERGPLDMARVMFSRLVVDGNDVDVPATVRPLLNAMWNAFGEPSCTMFDGQGRWTGVSLN